MTDFKTFALQAAETAEAISDLAESDRTPLELKIAKATVSFAEGNQLYAYRELRHTRYAAERIECERSRTGAAVVTPTREACISGM